MKVLLVFHGWFPDGRRPVSGGALRAWHHAQALTAAGHEVIALTREQDSPGTGLGSFSSGPALARQVAAIAPQVILCVQPEEAPFLAHEGIPLVVDLYAPRLLEALFEDRTAIEATRMLQALAAGDWFLFSNERQRHLWLSQLLLAGVDVRQDFGAVVPLVAPQGPKRRAARSPTFVMGGVAWPWQDPVEGLRRAAAHLALRKQGNIVVYGGAPVVGDAAVRDLRRAVGEGSRLQFAPHLPYEKLLAAYAGATAALDWMAPSPERELAVSFRHMDYLGCGLPLLTSAGHLMADWVQQAGAGLVGLPVEEALDRVLDDPAAHAQRALAARALAARFSRERCEAPLLRWLAAPCKREQRSTPLGDLATAWARVAATEAECARQTVGLQAAEAEVQQKRAEVARLVQQNQQLTEVAASLSGAVAEVAGFKREAVSVLGREQEVARQQATHLSRELSIARADIAKKTAELQAMEDEQRRLENDLVHARREIERLRKRKISIG